MTPPATAAARSAPRGSSAARTTPRGSSAARRAVRGPAGARSAAVRHPRRVSGPARPAAFAGGAVALPAPGVGRRIRTQSSPGVALRAIAAIDGASRSALIERLIRGRVWIGVLAFALIGLVAMQLVVLKLNNEIGHTLAREVVLQRQNAQIGIEASETSAGSLVEPQATAAGMTFAAPGSMHFLTARRGAVRQAAAALGSPIQPTSYASEAAPGSTSSEATPGGSSSEPAPGSSSSEATSEGSSSEATPGG